MGSSPIKTTIKKLVADINSRRNDIYQLLADIRGINTITQDEDFRTKTGYLIYFSFNETKVDKYINLFAKEKIIRANLVRFIYLFVIKNTLFKKKITNKSKIK